MPVVRTAAAPLTHEVERIKGSRFVVHVAPAADEGTALAVVGSRRDADPDASHHCWAFLLAGGRVRSSDDGEPSGSAGAPIARHLAGSGLVDVVVVVTRWFGGTQLGVGGLVRAYGGAAAEGLARVAVVERPVVARVQLTHPYELTGPVEGVLARFGVVPADAGYGADVHLCVDVPVEDVEGFAAALAEATAGRVVADPAEPPG